MQGTSRAEICCFNLTDPFSALLLFSRFHLCREFRKGMKNANRNSSWFDLKTSFHLPRLVPLFSDRSLWRNGKAPLISRTLGLFDLPIPRLKVLYLGFPTQDWLWRFKKSRFYCNRDFVYSVIFYLLVLNSRP